MAAATITCGVLLLTWHARRGDDEQRSADQTRAAVLKLDRQVKFRAAVSRAEFKPEEGLSTDVNQRGWPVTIDPDWFGANPPINRLTPPGCPWIEIASPDELTLSNPVVRVALDRDTAAFWYNPALGIVRARVGPTASDERAIRLYNAVNGTSVASIVEAPALLTAEEDATAEAKSP